jgi:hypothetical protein
MKTICIQVSDADHKAAIALAKEQKMIRSEFFLKAFEAGINEITAEQLTKPENKPAKSKKK